MIFCKPSATKSLLVTSAASNKPPGMNPTGFRQTCFIAPPTAPTALTGPVGAPTMSGRAAAASSLQSAPGRMAAQASRAAVQGDSSADSCDVLVIGGGLGGLALAVGLQELGNLDWRLCEQADELRTATGTLISFGANATAALDGLSPAIVPRLKAMGQAKNRMEVHVRPNGEAPRIKSGPAGTDIYTARWAAAQQVLSGLLDDKSRVLCAHKATGISEPSSSSGSSSPPQDGPWVTVHFKDQPDIRARFVVGADGVRSAIRSSLFPEHPGPRYLGHMNWNALRHVPGSSSGADADLIKGIWDSDGPEGFSTFAYLVNAGCDYEFFQVRMQYDEPTFTVPGRPGGPAVPGSRARVLQRLQELGWQDVYEAVEATDEAAIFERALVDVLPLRSWSTGSKRVVLLGDAAHAMHPGPGQGARSAYEDAHQLKLALQQHWPDAAAVVQQYEAARIPRATTIQYLAASNCGLKALREALRSCWAASPEVEQLGNAELSRWSNAYSDHPLGLPGAVLASPEGLRAYRERAAAATAEVHLYSGQP